MEGESVILLQFDAHESGRGSNVIDIRWTPTIDDDAEISVFFEDEWIDRIDFLTAE